MMYNHYIPESNGVYKKHSVMVPDRPAVQERSSCADAPPTKDTSCEEQQRPSASRFGWDLGDLLLLCIVLLLLLDSDEEDKFPILIAAAAFMFLQ